MIYHHELVSLFEIQNGDESNPFLEAKKMGINIGKQKNKLMNFGFNKFLSRKTTKTILITKIQSLKTLASISLCLRKLGKLKPHLLRT